MILISKTAALGWLLSKEGLRHAISRQQGAEAKEQKDRG
jgi:hypothetical protein